VVREMKSRPVRGDGILGKAAVVRRDLVEGCDAVAGLEFVNILSNRVYNSGDIITAVTGKILPAKRVA
jgi:hypothetical protein